MPLAYPSLALQDGDRTNRFFPLHKSVLVAVARELLLLEGRMHPETLQLLTKIPPLNHEEPPLAKKQKISPATAQSLVAELVEATVRSTEHRPRAVSDADDSIHAWIGGARDIARYCHVSDGKVTIRGETMPPMLEASIDAEEDLRHVARAMIDRLSASDKAWHLFLGYRSPILSREEVVKVASEYIFDVSHAYFAWVQTQRQSRGVSDEQIAASLFDERALRKIGGFEATGILRNAILVDRMGSKLWTESIQELLPFLDHHKSVSRQAAVGMKRRGLRLRKRRKGLRRMEAMAPQSTTILSPSVVLSVPDVPESVGIRLCRCPGSSWGVLLAKEGDMCIVARGSASERKQLQTGDLILRATTKDGTASSGVAECFREIVNLFKTANEIELIVQRVSIV